MSIIQRRTEMKILLRNLDKILTDLDSIKPENSAYSLLVGLKGFLKKEINNVLGEIKSPSELTPSEKLELIKEMLPHIRLFVGDEPTEGKLFSYLGCYILRWGKDKNPTMGFQLLNDYIDLQENIK
jgi:hypothetical protein